MHTLETVEQRLKKGLTYFGLLYDMGAGKTPTAINILRMWYAHEKRAMKTLIFTPPAVVRQWHEEWVKFGGERYKTQVVPLVGDGKKRIKLLKESKDAFIFVTNHEALSMPDFWQELKDFGFECCVNDESHETSNPTAKRTQALIGGPKRDKRIKRAITPFADTVKYKLILTGTLDMGNLERVWAQYRFLSPNIFSRNFYEWKNKYFVDRNAGMLKANKEIASRHFPNWEARPGTIERLNRIIFEHSHRVEKKDCLDLPPLVRLKRTVELSTPQKRAYQQMKDEYVAFLNGEICSAAIALTKLLRMQQMIAGVFKTEAGEVVWIGENRIKALKETLAEMDLKKDKVIIWCHFAECYPHIEKMLQEEGIGYRSLVGGLGDKKREEVKDAFKNDESVRALLANQAAGGTGLNLIVASYMVYYSKGPSLKLDQQSNDRNYRGGSEIHDQVTRIDLCTPNTTDEVINESLANKKDISMELMKQKLHLI